ncbi:MAG: YdgA family protein [Halomonas subglaciescola]|nr:YdgA family protein [Halomonas subglaciescola]
MRKERLIVPALALLTAAWLVAQLVSSVLFERNLSRALADLQARGEWRVKRISSDSGWLSSQGALLLSPLLGRPWRLELNYDARHGVLASDIKGTLRPRLDGAFQQALGNVSLASMPRWEGRYHTYSGRFDMDAALAPFVIAQRGRELAVRGARLQLHGVYGDWRLNAQLEQLALSDHDARLALGPVTLESRYTYIDGAYHFNQHDLLSIERLTLVHPKLNLTFAPLVLHTDMALDERELRIDGELTLGDVLLSEDAPDTAALNGSVKMALSGLNADAVRRVFSQLRKETSWGDSNMPVADGVLKRLEPALLDVLSDSPRLAISAVALNSPLLGFSVDADGALFFDARRLGELSLSDLDQPAMQARFLDRLDGDITWHNAPTVAALWLGLPLSAHEFTFDLIRGSWRVNGRALPDW